MLILILETNYTLKLGTRMKNLLIMTNEEPKGITMKNMNGGKMKKVHHSQQK